MTNSNIVFCSSEFLNLHLFSFHSFMQYGFHYSRVLGLDYLQVTQASLLVWLLPCVGHHGQAGTPWPSSLVCHLEAQGGCNCGLHPFPVLWGSLIPPYAQSCHPVSSSFSLTWLFSLISPFQLHCSHIDISHPCLCPGWTEGQGANTSIAPRGRRPRGLDAWLHKSAATEWMFKGEEPIKLLDLYWRWREWEFLRVRS